MDCDAIADYIDSIAKAHGRIVGQGWTLVSIQSVQQKEAGVLSLTSVVRVNPQTVVPRAGAKPRHVEGGRRIKVFHVSHSAGTWKLVALDQGV
jgi:hypothetical protein